MNNETISIHAGYDKHAGEKTMAVPIYQSTAYAFDGAEHAANLFSLKELGNIYTRLMNPTSTVLETRFAALEGGASAAATASGSSAIFYAIINLVASGENFIAANNLYGGTMTLFAHTLKRFGIEARFFDPKRPESIEALIDDKTRAIYFESLSNPGIDIVDFDAITAIADKYNIITICDNTVATPILFKPIENRIDIAVYSTSKYVTGQGLGIGGMIVDSAKATAKIKDNPRYAHFNEPDASYHGLVYSSLPFPPFVLRVRLSLLRDIGAAPSPFNSWLFIQGLETLTIRMKAHSEKALAVAKFLESHPKVKSVKYPGLSSHRDHTLLNKYFTGGMASGLLSFEAESFEAAKAVVNNVKIFTPVVNIGDSKSLVTHPASTTHSQMNAEELAKAGISDKLVRLSIGLEDENDLIADLKAALDA
jgi:O-acetylhomoserine (thiol)-lyase